MELQTIRRLYLAGVAVKYFDFDVDAFNEDAKQLQLLESTLQYPLSVQYSHSVQYRISFLKKFIRQLESFRIEVNESVYTALCELLNATDVVDKVYRIFELPSNGRVICAENRCALSNGTTGLSHWQGCYFLTQWAVDNKDKFKHKRILELGCGLGLAGLTIIQTCQPAEYTFTDGNGTVLSALTENFRNTFETEYCDSCTVNICTVNIQELDFCNNDEADWPLVDIVLASDVTFEPSLIVHLTRTLNRILTKNGEDCRVYLVHTIRNEQTSQLLRDQLEMNNIRIVEEKKVTLPALNVQVLPFGETFIGECILYILQK